MPHACQLLAFKFKSMQRLHTHSSAFSLFCVTSYCTYHLPGRASNYWFSRLLCIRAFSSLHSSVHSFCYSTLYVCTDMLLFWTLHTTHISLLSEHLLRKGGREEGGAHLPHGKRGQLALAPLCALRAFAPRRQTTACYLLSRAAHMKQSSPAPVGTHTLLRRLPRYLHLLFSPSCTCRALNRRYAQGRAGAARLHRHSATAPIALPLDYAPSSHYLYLPDGCHATAHALAAHALPVVLDMTCPLALHGSDGEDHWAGAYRCLNTGCENVRTFTYLCGLHTFAGRRCPWDAHRHGSSGRQRRQPRQLLTPLLDARAATELRACLPPHLFSSARRCCTHSRTPPTPHRTHRTPPAHRCTPRAAGGFLPLFGGSMAWLVPLPAAFALAGRGWVNCKALNRLLPLPFKRTSFAGLHLLAW